MRKLGRQLFAGPYLIWIIGFILLPLAMIVYYAFMTSDGSFTMQNIAAIADSYHGQFQFFAKDEIFTVRVLLPLVET